MIEEKVDGRGVALSTRKINEQSVRAKNIQTIIDEIKNITFEHVTALSEYIAEKYLSKHNEVIDSSTIRRNKHYRRKLNRFMEKGEEASSELIALTEDLLIADSENFQLNKELKTAKDTISKLLSERSIEKTKFLEDRTHGQIAEFDKTPCVALMKFIDHVGDFKIKHSGVFDTGELNEPLVLSPDDYPEFFAWYFKDGK